MPTAPTRTPAGEDELRNRTRKLGQRHRTVLLLIDGRRPLDELLSLAQQAGAAVSHFEELVHLGLVELPAGATAPDAPAAADALAAADAPAAADAAEAAPISAAEGDAAEPAGVPLQDEGEGDRLPGVPAVDLPPAEPVKATAGQAAAPHVLPVRAEAPAAAEGTPEERLLQQVRELLIDTLRIDSPLFGARTFLRVRNAQTTSELIDLVWEVEEHLAHSRHSRDELISLQRARELLGMGNTRFTGDTQSDVLPE